MRGTAFANSEDEALDTYIRSAQLITSCVTTTALALGPQFETLFQYSLAFDPQPPVAPLNGQALLLSVREGVLVSKTPSRRWKAKIAAYIYTVMDDRFRPLFSYEWHPHRHRSDPHFQIKQGASHHGLNKCHFPTGLIPLEAVIRLLIEEMDVRPIRNDWDDVLTSKGEQSE